MLFLAMHHGQISVYELGYDIRNEEEAELYMQTNGAPVEPYLIIEGNPNVPKETFEIASPEQVGWFDAGEHSDELYDITIKEINNILENSGHCEIEVEYENLDDDEADEYIRIVPVLLENKVTIRYILEDDYEEEDEEENDDEEDKEFDPADYYCDMCRGTGEGNYDGARCSFCKGSGINYKGSGDDYDDDRDYEHYSHYDY
jgi:hypothetical protein